MFQIDDVYQLQQKEWQPVIDWFCKKYSVNIQPTQDMVGPEIESKTKEIIERHFLSYNLPSLHGNRISIELAMHLV